MKARNISREKIETAVLYPDKWFYGSEGEINAVKKFGHKTIRVAYNSLPDHIKVITVIKE